MMNWILVAIAAGLAAAAMQAALSPAPVTLALFYLAPLPLFLAGLGWGQAAAGLGAAAGTLVMSLVFGIKPGLFFLASAGVAPILLTRLALLSRPVAATGASANRDAQSAPSAVEWYPEGRLVLWAAGFAGVLVAGAVLLSGPDPDTFHATLKAELDRVVVETTGPLPDEDKARLDTFTAVVARLAPLVAGGVWLVAMLINFGVAAKTLTLSGRAPRPWAKFGALSFPPRAALALGVAGAASLLPGTTGMIGSIFAAVLATAFVILGLAVVHDLVEGHPARPLLLAALYPALILFNALIAIPLILLALAEMLFGIRRRARPAGT